MIYNLLLHYCRDGLFTAPNQVLAIRVRLSLQILQSSSFSSDISKTPLIVPSEYARDVLHPLPLRSPCSKMIDKRCHVAERQRNVNDDDDLLCVKLRALRIHRTAA